MSLTNIAREIDPISPASSLKELIGQYASEWPVRSLAELEHRHGHPNRVTQRFIALNTFLMDTLVSSKPAVNIRDREIGAYTSRYFDLVCLGEVWHSENRKRLLEQWPDGIYFEHKSGKRSNGRRRAAAAAFNTRGLIAAILPPGLAQLGADAAAAAATDPKTMEMPDSAGLVTISRNLPIIARKFLSYDSETGVDSLANKGCLLTVLEVPADPSSAPSSLHIYNTHLQAGTDRRSRKARAIQVMELAKFIWRTRNAVRGNWRRPGRPGVNGVIVAGDFNIDRNGRETLDVASINNQLRDYPGILRDALTREIIGEVEFGSPVREKTEYTLLKNVFQSMGLIDLWDWRARSPGHTSDLDSSGVGEIICRPDPVRAGACSDGYDSESLERAGLKSKSIDYIFVSKNTRNMGFTMDFVRPSRCRTIRNPTAPEYEDISWLSDHLGVSTRVILSPRT